VRLTSDGLQGKSLIFTAFSSFCAFYTRWKSRVHILYRAPFPVCLCKKIDESELMDMEFQGLCKSSLLKINKSLYAAVQ